MADSNVYVEGVNSSIIQNLQEAHMTTDDAVKSIDLQLKEIVSNGLKISQSSLQDLLASGVYDRRDAEGRTARRDVFAERRERSQANRANALAGSNANKREEQWERDLDTAFNQARPRRRRSSSFDDIMDSWENEFQRSLFGTVNPIKQALTSSVSGLAQKLGVSTQDLAKEVGARLGKQMGDAFKQSPIGARLTAEWAGIVNRISGSIGNFANRLGDRLSTTDVNSAMTVSDTSAQTAKAQTQSAEARAQSILNSNANRVQEQSIENADTFSNEIESMVQTVSASQRAFRGLANGANAADNAFKITTSSVNAVNEANLLAASNASELGGAVAGAGAAFPALTLALAGGAVALEVFSSLLSKVLAPVKEAFSKWLTSVENAANRVQSQSSKNIELWNNRVREDIKTLREQSFAVIKESAQHIEEVWDNILKTVTATQGYDKEAVQDLWANYASKLQSEGLSSVISSADIMEKLSSVLQSGLSGAVAEEFAYQATLLNNAIPTQDFFQYASTYASIAANAIKAGASQQEALDLATNELNEFASNLLYASREIAGGFTTSLSNSASLFEQSAKIALTSRIGDVSDISGVLTSVSAIVGAIAPDLADSLVTAVVEAATGGNSSNITALRSMAGTGASNTAFLTALSKAPKEVFETLFRNLSQLQNMSAANYMEVAEGLSQVFGVSMDAFARVDFAYLADAIHEMNLNNSSLDENLALLVSGETTSNDAQMRMKQINQYMVDEGLAYVLDNAAARSIQEHMWQEQMMQEIEASTFAVELTGTGLTLLQTIANADDDLFDILSPAAGIARRAKNLALTSIESDLQSDEIVKVLEAGAVGRGDTNDLYNLTHGAVDLNLNTPYLNLLGGTSYQTSFSDKLSKGILGSLFSTSAQGGSLSEERAAELLEKGIQINQSTNLRSQLEEVRDSIANGMVSKSSGSGGRGSSRASSVSPTSYYTTKLVSKSAANAYAKSGDWRTATTGYNAYYDSGYAEDLGAKTQEQAKALTTSIISGVQGKVTGITEYVSKYMNAANEKYDELAKTTHREFYTQSELLDKVVNTNASMETGSFEEWKTEFERQWNNEYIAELARTGHQVGNDYRAKTLQEILADYGADLSEVEALFNAQQVERVSAQTKARELHEVQFWEDMQNFATKDFPDYMLDFKEYMKNWADYYIRHTAYGNETAGAYVDEKGKPITGEAFTDSSSIGSLMMASEQGQGDAILALAQMLTDNATYQNKSLEQLKDPTLQTNAILSKILLVVEAIMQQNNETSIVSIPQSLSALGLGTVNM